jgi:hypothetical protein
LGGEASENIRGIQTRLENALFDIYGALRIFLESTVPIAR